MLKGDKNCEICKGEGLVGTYYHAIDDNDVEPCSCVYEDGISIETIECEVCGGSGFSRPGTGYDAVCDNCGGLGKHPI